MSIQALGFRLTDGPCLKSEKGTKRFGGCHVKMGSAFRERSFIDFAALYSRQFRSVRTIKGAAQKLGDFLRKGKAPSNQSA